MLKGNLVELRPVSKDDLKHLFKWSNDEEIANLAHGSDSAYQNNNPQEDIEAFYEKNLTAQPLWENGRVFIVYTMSTGVP
ncbi:N-acetyltransferase, partial [Halobacillus trueperi]